MLRNPFTRLQEKAPPTPSLAVPVVAGPESAASVGTNDATTGEWKVYGILDVTTFAEGFLLSGDVRS